MKPKILLANPAIYDFSAYDFWMKPFGLLRVAGHLREKAELCFFDYMDRAKETLLGRGSFYSEAIPKPLALKNIPRRYRRFGLPRKNFQNFLEAHLPFDYALIQTVMTYWYLGVTEVIQDIRAYSPKTKIVLGGVYATLCPEHAQRLGADLVIEGHNLDPLWKEIGITPKKDPLPFWEAYPKLQVGVLKLTEGCPFRCTYCSVSRVYPKFIARSMDASLAELKFLYRRGARNIVFYDDALLYQPQKILTPFLERVLEEKICVNFHTPNALNARFISAEIAHLMVRAGFKTFYLGFESSTNAWQRKTGGKVSSDELAHAVKSLREAGVDSDQITAYLILAHPHGDQQYVEESMRFAHRLGIRTMLSEFSPIPGTLDGEACHKWVDLKEPLLHNKTAFPIIFLGNTEVNRLKNLCQELNANLTPQYQAM